MSRDGWKGEYISKANLEKRAASGRPDVVYIILFVLFVGPTGAVLRPLRAGKDPIKPVIQPLRELGSPLSDSQNVTRRWETTFENVSETGSFIAHVYVITISLNWGWAGWGCILRRWPLRCVPSSSTFSTLLNVMTNTVRFLSTSGGLPEMGEVGQLEKHNSDSVCCVSKATVLPKSCAALPWAENLSPSWLFNRMCQIMGHTKYCEHKID